MENAKEAVEVVMVTVAESEEIPHQIQVTQRTQ